ncbi:AMP-binding protein [Salicibibacter cibarius]|uniref:AMP-binding protein n=1 Tax=Salicibibacter cibarius TaxID=2743000 RepID=A0A7T7CBZ9_9BACI|nr:AMP-binding protein [Salicibibacter cibarius]QQK76428.1 AMP-binding protein [Salicibibacter cibarius]
MNVGELYTLNCAHLGEKPAIICEGQSISHRELEKRTNQVAHLLMSMGYKKNDRIAIVAKNHIEYPVIIIGAAKAGVSFTPINYRMTEEEIAGLLQHCRPRGLFFSEEYLDIVENLKAHIGVSDYFNIDNFASMELNLQPNHKPQIELESQDIYYIGYTSGTTGTPKGSVVSHESRGMLILINAVEFGIGTGGVHLVAGPIYHSAPHVFLLTQLVMGGTVVLMKEFDPEEVLKHISEYQVTNMFMAPTMYNFVLDLDERTKERYDISSVKTMISGGSSLPTRIKEKITSEFANAGLYEFYGASETGVNTLLYPHEQLQRPQSAGKAAPFNDIKILDDEGNEVPTGEVGTIYTKNPYYFKGYLDRPEETAKVFHHDYITAGDLATKDDDGYIYIVGRKKDMVISGGVNIFPEEIEEVLYKHPDIKEAAVIGVPDEKWGESLKAFIVSRNNDLKGDAVIDFVKQHLASYKKPKIVDFVNELPRNASGKILKRELRQPYWEQTGTKR